MNSSRYIVARLLLAFGIHRKTKRLSEAADEMHLLRQAEDILGEDVWEQTEDIEGLGVEYWNLRKLKMATAKLKDAIQEADQVLNSSHEERNMILTRTNEECQELEAKRKESISQSDTLVLERDQIIAEAKVIKRQFEASKMKMEVLSQEQGSEPIIEKEKMKIASLKLEFKKLKQKRDDIGVKIQQANRKVMNVEAALGEDRKKLRAHASSAYQSIGKANQDISKMAAEVGTLENEMKIHFMAIGCYVSRQVGIDPLCTEIAKKHMHLITQMQCLRSSIALNQRLAAMVNN